MVSTGLVSFLLFRSAVYLLCFCSDENVEKRPHATREVFDECVRMRMCSRAKTCRHVHLSPNSVLRDLWC